MKSPFSNIGVTFKLVRSKLENWRHRFFKGARVLTKGLSSRWKSEFVWLFRNGTNLHWIAGIPAERGLETSVGKTDIENEPHVNKKSLNDQHHHFPFGEETLF